MESSVPPGKSKTEPPPHKWGEFWGSAIAIFTLILPVAAIVHYSPASSVQALPNLSPAALTEWHQANIRTLTTIIQFPIPSKMQAGDLFCEE